MFRLFDVDGDNFVSASDLEKILSMMTGKSMDTGSMDEIVHRTIAASDADKDGQLSEEEFLASVAKYPWSSFTVPVKGTSRMQYFADLEREGGGGLGTIE